VAGIGAIVRSHPDVLTVVRWVGVVYLLGYAAHSFWRARRPEVLLPGDEPPKPARTVALAMLGFTLLNPHVYLDTVLLLGSIANQYGDERWWFAAGAATASVTWFSTLGFGATVAAPLMSRPITWRILDVVIGLVMVVIAVSLLRSDLAA
jgi:L-lysine exporter family protein LysE/ArgO